MSIAGSATRAAAQRARFAYAFLALALAVNVAAMAMHRRAAGTPRHAAVDAAILADMAITVPVAYFLLVARPRRQSGLTFGAVAALSALRGLSYQPFDPRVHLAIGGALELALVAFVVMRVRAATARAGAGTGDPLVRLRDTLESLIPAPRAADIIAAEIGVFLYAFASWRSRPDAPDAAQAFTIHRRGGAATLLGVLAVMTVVESAIVHLIVGHWSRTGAWVLTGLSIYSAVWCVAMARALVLRPCLVERDRITLRAGLLWTLSLRREDIARVTSAPAGLPRRADGYVRLTALTPASLVIDLASPQTAHGLLGMTRRVTRVGIAPDDPEGFVRALNG